MTQGPSPNGLEELREVVFELAGPMLAEEDPCNQGELELLALDLMGAFADPDALPALVAMLPDALEARKDELGAGLLAAIAALGPRPLAGQAGRARDRLESEGIRSPLADSVGALHTPECYRRSLDDGETEALAITVERAGDPRTQTAAVMLEHEPRGGVIVEGLLTTLHEPDTEDSPRHMLDKLEGSAAPTETLSPPAVARRLRAALHHMQEHDLELTREEMLALLVLERALTGRNGHWPRPAVIPLDDEAEAPADDELDGLRELADELLEIFVAELEADELGDAELREHGPDVAFLMTHWKIDYADQMFTRWTHADLREFLLEWYPRKGDSDDETLAIVPGAVVSFLRFLDRGRLLSGGEIEALAATVERLRERFEDEARDPRNWGPAKAVVTQMRREGVEPTDPAALDEWMADFNSRPFEERDRMLGPSTERTAASGRSEPKSTPSRGQEDRRSKRKAARSARKRNRG